MKYFLFLFFFSFGVMANAQTTDPVFNKRLSEYIDISRDLKIDLLLNYMYPRIFEIAPRKDLKAALEGAYHNESISIKLDSVITGKVDPISKFSKGAFTRFEYKAVMTVQLLGENMEGKADAVLQNFKLKFGEKNVSYDNDTKLFRIRQHKEALAIKDNFSKNLWTFIGLEKEMNLTAIIPAAVKTHYHIK
jgi:hypothetical protein